MKNKTLWHLLLLENIVTLLPPEHTHCVLVRPGILCSTTRCVSDPNSQEPPLHRGAPFAPGESLGTSCILHRKIVTKCDKMQMC